MLLLQSPELQKLFHAVKKSIKAHKHLLIYRNMAGDYLLFGGSVSEAALEKEVSESHPTAVLEQRIERVSKADVATLLTSPGITTISTPPKS